MWLDRHLGNSLWQLCAGEVDMISREEVFFIMRLSIIKSATKCLCFNSGHRTGKGQFSFQSQRKSMPKNAQTIAQLHSSHASKVMPKILQSRLQQYMNHEIPDVQAGFRKRRRTRDQIANIWWIIEKVKEFQKNIYFCFIDYAKAFDCVDHSKQENSERDGNTRPPDLPLKKPICSQEATVRNRCGTDWFQIGKGVYCHPAYLTYIQSTS